MEQQAAETIRGAGTTASYSRWKWRSGAADEILANEIEAKSTGRMSTGNTRASKLKERVLLCKWQPGHTCRPHRPSTFWWGNEAERKVELRKLSNLQLDKRRSAQWRSYQLRAGVTVHARLRKEENQNQISGTLSHHSAHSKGIPILLSIPALWRWISEEIKSTLSREYDRCTGRYRLVCSEALWFRPAMGITIIHAVYSRWVIDLNRDPWVKQAAV